MIRRLDNNLRKYPRYPMHWKIAIVFDEVEQLPTYHGVTNEISQEGLSLLTDHNLFTEDLVTLLLAIPPKNSAQRSKIVEVRARMIYTVHSAGHDQFRIGMHFERFKGNGRKLLETNLKERTMVLTA
jgi:hypothetical protein